MGESCKGFFECLKMVLKGDLNKGYKFLADNRKHLIEDITLEDFIHNN